MTIETICWRRLDMPGQDACRLEQLEDGWLLAQLSFASIINRCGSCIA
jgi:hypothetical protein